MSNLLGDGSLYLPSNKVNYKVTKDKGQKMMEGLLLNQYQNSPNLKKYMMAFISEMDFLFEQIQEVQIGRYIENAAGKQLDIIGIILQQSRAIVLPTVWFGFVGATNVDGMADETTPARGGLFKDGNVEEGAITPMDDTTYRKILLAKALILNRDSADLNLTYFIIQTILGRAPSILRLRDEDSGEGIEKRRVDLLIERSVTTLTELRLILYMAKYFVPSGIVFTITQV